MFGSLRFVLALGVVISHLWAGLSHWSAVYAVFGFFLLSGYLMTLVLHESYGFTPRGQMRYLANRALRIYPVYWLALILSLAAAPVIGESTYPIRIFVPDDAASWVANIVIFGLDNGSTRVFPPAWTLYTEFIFYILMGLGLSRWRAGVALWLAASLAWTIWLVSQARGFEPLYYAISPATLPFATGAAIYLLLGARNWKLPRPVILAAALIFTVHLFAADKIWGREGIFLEGFYVSLLLAAICVAALAGLRVKGRFARIDRLLGDISYPVFLLHWAVGALAVSLFGMKSGTGLFLVSLPVTVGLSVLLHRVAELPINRYRDAIRAGEQRDTA